MNITKTGLLPKIEPRFILLPPTTRTSGVSINTNVPLPGFSINNRVGSFKSKATMNEGFVSPATKDKSFYELLGIPETGTTLDVKKAYKELARKYHPDVSPPDLVDEYTEMFIMVHEAYETLSDPKRRALYDSDMAQGLHLAFSSRRPFYEKEEMDGQSGWRNRWEVQLQELKRRSEFKRKNVNNTSWAARLRNERNESSD